MTMKLEKVDKIWLQDGKTYTGWGYYNDIGNFIPQGCGKKYYNDYYVYGNYKNGILNGPAIESHNTYMKTIQFKDNNGNGWGLCINRGMLIEFGYYRDCKLKTNLIDFVYWYYTKLEDSSRASQNMLSMYTFNDTKEVAELLIGYKGGTTTFGLSVPFMGFRFKPDGSVWVGDTATRKLSGTLIHFCPNGEIEAGFFVDGILKRRMGIQNILNAYFFEEEDRSAFKNIPDVIINHNYFESFGEDSIYQLKENKDTMDYHVLELAYNGSSEFNKIDKELWKIGDKVIITPHGNLNIINAVFVDQSNLVGIELQVNGKINFGEFRGITKREKIVSINTFAVMRQPNNAWLWIYAFDEIGNPVATFCGHDNIDGLFHYVRRMKCIYKKF